MATINANVAFKKLREKGFTVSDQKYSDFKYFEFYHNDQLILHTKLTRGKESTLGEEVIRQMTFQLKLNREELFEFLEGEMTQEEYVELLIERGVISEEGE